MPTQSEISELLKDITADVRTIVKGELELAKVELMPQAKSVGIGAGLFGGAGVMGLSAVGLLGLSLSFLLSDLYSRLGWSQLFSLFVGFLTMTAILGAVAAVLALIGRNKVSVKGPEQTVSQGQETVAAVVKAVERGRDSAEAEADQRKAARSATPMLESTPPR